MNFKDIGISVRIWVDQAHDRDYLSALMNAGLNFRVPRAIELDRLYSVLRARAYEQTIGLTSTSSQSAERSSGQLPHRIT